MSELVLGIESSCDETAAAVVEAGVHIRSSVVESQVALHAEFGGVVPEIASRSHLQRILPVVDRALDEAGIGLGDLSAIAVTRQPGLVGSLLVGVSTAKALAWTRSLPLVGVHHIEAHVYAATMEHADFSPPAVALVVSGGHTALYRYGSHRAMELLADTLDDAAGEAFDKVAWLLGLEYPGGPAISHLAEHGDRSALDLPRYRPRNGTLGFSFSGIKTAVLYHLRGQDALAPTPPPESIADAADVAASFQEAVVDVLCEQTLAAALRERVDSLVVAGGVACNVRLRERLANAAMSLGLRSFFPSPAYCTDNAAMIAGLGYHLWREGCTDGFGLDASPS